jgi:hypothetical protein
MGPVSRRGFLAATGGAIGLTTAAVAAGTASAGAASRPKARSFTNQNSISNTAGGVELSKGASPPPGRVWVVRRVFWNVNYDGNVADQVQTYLYRLPSSYTTAQAATHMESSLVGWLGCCGNADLTGNGDMQYDENDVVVSPSQQLWIWFIVPAVYDNWVMAAGMTVWEEPA